MENVRNKQIDGLRGIMALIIVLFHLFCRYQQLYCESSIVFMENWGVYGVCTFFIISGYFLVDSRENDDFHLLRFYKKRLLRLYPMYLVSITLTMLILLVAELPDRTVSITDYVLNLVWINGFINTPYVDGAHWYITILISSILICGLLKAMKLSNNPIAYMVILALSSLCLVFHVPVLSLLLGGGYIGIVFCGVAIRKIGRSDSYGKKKWIALMLVSCAFTWKTRRGASLVGLLMGVLLCYGALTNRFRFLECGLFQYLGTISFELYLIHQNIAYAIEYKLLSANGSFSYWYPLIALISVLCLSSMLYGAKAFISNKKRKG